MAPLAAGANSKFRVYAPKSAVLAERCGHHARVDPMPDAAPSDRRQSTFLRRRADSTNRWVDYENGAMVETFESGAGRTDELKRFSAGTAGFFHWRRGAGGRASWAEAAEAARGSGTGPCAPGPERGKKARSERGSKEE